MPQIEKGQPEQTAAIDDVSTSQSSVKADEKVSYVGLGNRIVYVDVDAIGANNGMSWFDAYWYLQDVLAAAVSGDEIRVAKGTYKPDRSSHSPDGSGDRAATFQLKNGVIIIGGYAGFGESDPNVRDVGLYATILSGDLSGNDVGGPDDPSRAENSYHVVTGSGTDETAVLDGFTIASGNANGPHPYQQGGGMYNHASQPTLNNCIFSYNLAANGGGMWNGESCPKLTNCSLTSNSVKGEWASGAGMENYKR